MIGVLIFSLIFLVSFFLLFWSGNVLVEALKRISKFLGWKEFVVSFFIVGLSTTIPNFIIDLISAAERIPHLALGDVIGGNIVDLTLIVGISALISRAGLSLSSRTVQGSSIFTILVAILPLVLIFDGELSRGDGILLLFTFFIYIFWLFQKKERFEKIYDGIKEPLTLKFFFKNILLLFFSISILLLSGQGIVKSALFFSNFFKIPLIFIGTLIVGFGNALPEFSFCFQAARKSQDWMIIGDVMGSVILCATLVLGSVALISPIKIFDSSQLVVARIFLLISAIIFLVFARTGRKITKTEALFLLFLYFCFLLTQILFLINING
jgi:cation:H+ antiporter